MQKNFRMSKTLRTKCKSIDKAVRDMINSHKGKDKALVDYAHQHFLDLNDAPVNIKKKDLILRWGFVDSILFIKASKYAKVSFSRKTVTDELIR